MTQEPKKCGAKMPLWGSPAPQHNSCAPLCPISHHLLPQLALLAPEEDQRPTPQHPRPPHPATPSQLHHSLHPHYTLCNYETPPQIRPIFDSVFCPFHHITSTAHPQLCPLQLVTVKAHFISPLQPQGSQCPVENSGLTAVSPTVVLLSLEYGWATAVS